MGTFEWKHWALAVGILAFSGVAWMKAQPASKPVTVDARVDEGYGTVGISEKQPRSGFEALRKIRCHMHEHGTMHVVRTAQGTNH